MPLEPDQQEQALIGEWRGAPWPGVHGDTSILVIHKIDAANGKAQCTYTVNQKDMGKSEYEILADYLPGTFIFWGAKELWGYKFIKISLPYLQLMGSFTRCGHWHIHYWNRE